MGTTDAAAQGMTAVVAARYGHQATDLAVLRWLAAVRFSEPVSPWTDLLSECVDAYADAKGIDKQAINGAIRALAHAMDTLGELRELPD